MPSSVCGCSYLRAPSGTRLSITERFTRRLGPLVSKLYVNMHTLPHLFLSAKAVMEVTPEVSELSNDAKNEHQRTEPKFSFSFPPKVNFQFSQWWEDSIINMLSVSFNMRLPQPGTRLNYGPLEIAY